MMRRSMYPKVFAFAAVAFGACTFPDYILPGDGTSSASTGGAMASTAADTTEASTGSTASMGSTGSTASAGGAGTSSGSPTSSAESTTASTGTGTSATCAEPCDPTGGVTCVQSCVATSMDPDCDCDGDGEILDTPACKSAHPAAPIDCYDCNKSAKHGQAGYFVVDRGDGDFDYDCNNLEEPQYTTACGEGLLTCTKPYRYDMTPGCGKNGNLFACTAVLNVVACTAANTSNVAPQSCH